MNSRQDQHQALLQELEASCADLPLCQVPQDIVIGQGNLEADVMFIGEAPGAEEARLRVPFVGRSGKLLNRTLEEHGMHRDDFYVSNIVKVRPPNNRDPQPHEIEAYLPYLLREIELIQPVLFVTLGRFAMNFFLPSDRISAVHGVLKHFRWKGQITHLLPLYHPAAALRSSSLLETFSADVAKIPKAVTYARRKSAHDKQLNDIKQALF